MHQRGVCTVAVADDCDADDIVKFRIQRGCSQEPANRIMARCNDGVLSPPPPSMVWKQHTGPPLTNTLEEAVACALDASFGGVGAAMEGSHNGSGMEHDLGLGGNIVERILSDVDTGFTFM